jgi:hypothetical protein
MTTYERIEFSERARRVFSPGKACVGAVKIAASNLAERFGVSWGRAKELLKGRALPTVREMDLIREMDGAWCPVERKVKPDMLERMHDKIDALYSAYVERREAKRARKDFMQRVAAE